MDIQLKKINDKKYKFIKNNFKESSGNNYQSFKSKIADIKTYTKGTTKRIIKLYSPSCVNFLSSLEIFIDKELKITKNFNNLIAYNNQPLCIFITDLTKEQYNIFRQNINKTVQFDFELKYLRLLDKDKYYIDISIINIDNPNCIIQYNIDDTIVDEQPIVNEVELKREECINFLMNINSKIEKEIKHLQYKKQEIINHLSVLYDIKESFSMEEINNIYEKYSNK